LALEGTRKQQERLNHRFESSGTGTALMLSLERQFQLLDRHRDSFTDLRTWFCDDLQYQLYVRRVGFGQLFD
jgi:hypothetical protein